MAPKQSPIAPRKSQDCCMMRTGCKTWPSCSSSLCRFSFFGAIWLSFQKIKRQEKIRTAKMMTPNSVLNHHKIQTIQSFASRLISSILFTKSTRTFVSSKKSRGASRIISNRKCEEDLSRRFCRKRAIRLRHCGANSRWLGRSARRSKK